MAGRNFHGTYASTITLTNPKTENPATITAAGLVKVASGDGVVGASGFAWTVTNLGTVESSALTGILLDSGGEVTNGSSRSTSASVAAAGIGVAIEGGAGAVTNFGTIRSTATTIVAAINLGAGGAVTNGSAADTKAVISGSYMALFVASGSATVNNFGTIQTTGTAQVPTVFLGGGGSVTNGSAADRKALITGDHVVVNLGPGGTATNFGRIEATGTGNPGGTGVFLGTGGRMANFGTITAAGENGFGVNLGTGGSLRNTGVITAYHIGAFAGTATGAGTVGNYGTILSTQKAEPIGFLGEGVLLLTGGDVTNGSATDDKALIAAAYGNAIAINGGTGTVTNFGTLKNGSGSHSAIYLGAGGNIANGSSSATTALIEGGTGVNLHSGGTVTNFATIVGTIGSGAYLPSGGTVINGAERAIRAVIKSAGDTVLVEGAAGTVANFGTIENTGTDPAIFLAAGGTVSNGAKRATGAVIESGASVGVSIKGAAGTVGNLGTISSGGTHGAVYLGAGGTVTNGAAGSTKALLKGAGNGINVAAGAGLIVNFGTIAGGLYNGVKLQAGGAIANHGLIAGKEDGVYLGTTSSAGTVTNFGTITGAVGFAVGAGNTANNSLTNAGKIVGNGGSAVAFGAGNDVLTVDRHAVFVGAVTGGGGSNTVVEGDFGKLAVKGFSGFETIRLADGGKDLLMLTQGNFAGVTGNTITVIDGDKGSDVTGTGLAAADILVVHAGAGADLLKGGAEADVFYAGGDTTMTGGTGANEFIFALPGNNTIKGFRASSTNELVFSDKGFALGLPAATALPQQFTAAEAAKLFIADTTGKFTSTSQRLAYDTGTGQLFFGKDGSGGKEQLVVTLADHAPIAASQLFFVT